MRYITHLLNNKSETLLRARFLTVKQRFVLGLLGVSLLFFYGCGNESTDDDTVFEISYTLQDSVSPVMATLRLNKTLQTVTWFVDDSIVYSGNALQSYEVTLTKPGNNWVKVVAYDKDNAAYTTERIVVVPNVATELIVNGFVIPDKSDFNIQHDSVLVSFFQNDERENPSYYRTLSVTDFLENDTIWFDLPVTFEVFHSNDYLSVSHSTIYFSLEEPSSPTSSSRVYYRSNFSVYDAYMDRLQISSTWIEITDFIGLDKPAVLLVAWK